jgi:hypothetical protein
MTSPSPLLAKLIQQPNLKAGMSFAELLGGVFLFIQDDDEARSIFAELRDDKAKRVALKKLLIDASDLFIGPEFRYRHLINDIFEEPSEGGVASWIASVVLQLMIAVEEGGKLTGPEKQRLVQVCAKGLLRFSGLGESDQALGLRLIDQSIQNFIKAKKQLRGVTEVIERSGCCAFFRL